MINLFIVYINLHCIKFYNICGVNSQALIRKIRFIMEMPINIRRDNPNNLKIVLNLIIIKEEEKAVDYYYYY